jgi:hypothetical protein
MRFSEILERVGRMRGPDGLPEEWLSPYRLLWGAAYSIGKAEQSAALATDVPVPPDLSTSLAPAVQRGGDELPWFHRWKASYLLTNAIFRNAAAAEKICFLTAGQTEWRREDLWTAMKKPGSDLSKKLPQAYHLLRHMPARLTNRARYLKRQREVFQMKGRLPRPLICAFIQTDTDKHVPYPPLKELFFDFTLASGSFLEACELWDGAVNAERGG